MKKWFTALALLSSFQISFGQDDAILAAPLGSIMAPATGCALTSTETVTVRIFNSGPGTINAPFDVSYNITGPVNSSATETVLVGSIPMNSTLTYTFTATADLSVAGTYSMDATVTVVGDPNATNNTYTGYSITNNAASSGGTANGSTTVCYNSNSGNMTLVGNVGSVLNWEYSDDLGITWFNISNTTTSQSYDDLTTETWYRANVQNASCPVSTSTIAKALISPTSVGGTTAGGTTPACASGNSGTITLSGKTGNVLQWESSIDGGATWSVIANTTTSNPYINLTTTTRYRAQVQSGVCPAVYSSQRIITINPLSVGGAVTANATECSGSNGATLTLAGNTGTIPNWQSSTDGGATWSTIANTTPTQTYTNLTTTTLYRAQVKSGVCATVNSTPATITIVPNSNGGTISSSMTVCNGANDDTLVLSGFVGSIMDWESSIDGGLTFSPVGTTNDSLFFTNLTVPTVYRAIVQAGSCASANSTPVTVSIDQPTVGGTLSSDATECASSNNGTINLLGQTGTTSFWESSTDAGATWTPIANTTTALNYTNLSTTTLYRTTVQNGTCLPALSDTVTITVDPITVGGTVSSNTTICESNNSGTLTLTGETGNVLNWESSSDGGFTWVSIANTTTSQGYLNLSNNTLYRAVVQSGVCPSTISGIATLTVDQATDAGNILGATTVCEGTNSGVLNLAGHTGSVLNWEMSTDGGSTWLILSNNTIFQNYLNLSTTTSYRANVKNGVCPATPSSAATISVSPQSEGGAVTSSAVVCENQNSGVLTLTAYAGTIQHWESSSDNGLTWNFISNSTLTQPYLNLTDSTWYRAIVQNGTCPVDTSAIAYINIHPAPIADFVQDTVCSGNAMPFLNITTNPAGFATLYSWDFGDGNTSTLTSPNHTYASAGLYNVILFVMNNFGCSDSISHTMLVNATPVADIQASGPTSFCEGDSVQIGNILDPDYTYLWITGETTNSIVVDSTHDYGIYVTSISNGCYAFDSLEVTVFPAPIANAGLDTNVSLGSSTILTGSGGTTFLWSPATGLDNSFNANPTCTPLSTTTYTLLVTDDNGCTSTDSVTISLNGNILLTIYDIITPNGDNFNDTWFIDNIQNYPNNTVSVFNRYGQVVYEANSYANDWDGTRNGDELPEGAYYYVVELTDSGDAYKGTVNIVRSK